MFLFLVFTVLWTFSTCSSTNSIDISRDYCANETDIIDHILYDTTVHYNRHKTPADPVTVRIELWIQEVTSVSEMTQDFEIGKQALRWFSVFIVFFSVFIYDIPFPRLLFTEIASGNIIRHSSAS